MSEIRWKQRFNNFKKALSQLEKAVKLEKYSELEQQGLIQCFNYTIELAWKTLQDYLDFLGYDTKGPKPVIKQAFSDGLIVDGNAWIEMWNDRNLANHTYDEETANEIASRIVNNYYFLLKNLNEKLSEKLNNEEKDL